jgi:23S rRNA pseudouridine1911/1915/1917 synthase
MNPADIAADLLDDRDDDVASPPPAGGLQRFSLLVDEQVAGQRLDAFLAAAIAGVSRARLRRSFHVAAGERIEVAVADAVEAPQPDPIPLDLLFEDEHLAVVNKPPGMVVHPAKGHWSGTLAGALVHRFNTLSAVGGAVRPGIVHRLDRDTSGVIVVAKTDAAHQSLAAQFHDRLVQKEYLAIIAGAPDRDADRVSEPIGPHPTHRERMALRGDHHESRPAETFFEVVERFPGFALMRAHPKTGRTHQVRLHLAHIRCPVLCDRQYGSRSRITLGELRGVTRHKRLAAELPEETVLLSRQALHAHRLKITHPATGEPLVFEAPLPEDMACVLDLLRQTAQRSS